MLNGAEKLVNIRKTDALIRIATVMSAGILISLQKCVLGGFVRMSCMYIDALVIVERLIYGRAA